MFPVGHHNKYAALGGGSDMASGSIVPSADSR